MRDGATDGQLRVGIVMNGVTGRMGSNQHLARSIDAIRQQGGVALPDGGTIWPHPVLVGRNPEKLRALAAEHGIQRWRADLTACLESADDTVYFDAQTTELRAAALSAAIAAGKHVYCAEPVAANLATALDPGPNGPSRRCPARRGAGQTPSSWRVA